MARHQVGASRTREEEVAALPCEHRVSIHDQIRKAVERLPAKQVFYLVPLDCAKTVPKSNDFIPFELSLSEKQIPRFVGNVGC
jgi:hypothetical protein